MADQQIPDTAKDEQVAQHIQIRKPCPFIDIRTDKGHQFHVFELIEQDVAIRFQCIRFEVHLCGLILKDIGLKLLMHQSVRIGWISGVGRDRKRKEV